MLPYLSLALAQHIAIGVVLRLRQGGAAPVDLVGRRDFHFGTQRSGAGAADFPLRLLSLRQHSVLRVHAGAGVTLAYAGMQARPGAPPAGSEAGSPCGPAEEKADVCVCKACGAPLKS
jgi:hypothetical protein